MKKRLANMGFSVLVAVLGAAIFSVAGVSLAVSAVIAAGLAFAVFVILEG